MGIPLEKRKRARYLDQKSFLGEPYLWRLIDARAPQLGRRDDGLVGGESSWQREGKASIGFREDWKLTLRSVTT